MIWQRAENVYLGREVRCEKFRVRRGYTIDTDASGREVRLQTAVLWYDTGMKSQKTKEEYTGTVGFVLRQPGLPKGRIMFAPRTVCGCVNGATEGTNPDEVLLRSMSCSHCGAVLGGVLREWQRRDTSGRFVYYEWRGLRPEHHTPAWCPQSAGATAHARREQ